MHDQLIDLLLTGTIDTLIMVGASAFFALLIGLPMAVVLVSTSEHGIYPSKSINHSLGWLVNITRSVPFLILMVALIPLTRWIVGTIEQVVEKAKKMAAEAA
jgi:D-methionine transport system permease protein